MFYPARPARPDRPPCGAAKRRLLDLDADPVAVAEALGADPVLMARWWPASPGQRMPGASDGNSEMAVRAVIGQQVSVAGARTVLGRIVVAQIGRPRQPSVTADRS